MCGHLLSAGYQVTLYTRSTFSRPPPPLWHLRVLVTFGLGQQNCREGTGTFGARCQAGS
jgi:hypothetical protein